MDDRKSVNDICIKLGGNLITWSSRKQSVVARPITDAKCRALASAASDLLWVQNLLTKIGVNLPPHPPILWYDNLSAQALAKNPVYHARTKHIELDVHFVCNLITDSKLDVCYIPSYEQPVDLLTEALSLAKLQTLCTKLAITIPKPRLRGHVKSAEDQLSLHVAASASAHVNHQLSSRSFSEVHEKCLNSNQLHHAPPTHRALPAITAKIPSLEHSYCTLNTSWVTEK